MTKAGGCGGGGGDEASAFAAVAHDEARLLRCQRQPEQGRMPRRRTQHSVVSKADSAGRFTLFSSSAIHIQRPSSLSSHLQQSTLTVFTQVNSMEQKRWDPCHFLGKWKKDLCTQLPPIEGDGQEVMSKRSFPTPKPTPSCPKKPERMPCRP
jgi:hypothetical protein